MRLALEAVREAVDADTVYWHSEHPGEGRELVGSHPVQPEWCHQLVRRLLTETPGVDGQLLRSNLPPASLGPSPRSAALVRLSKSRCSWIVALSFRPERLFNLDDMKIMSLARRMVLNQRKHSEITGKLKETVSCLVHCLTTVIDSRVPHRAGHSERVAQIAARLAQQMRLPAEAVSNTYFAGLLHDIGTINLPEAVLFKPERLTDEEFAHITECPVVGDRLLARIKQLGHLRPAVRHHHERFDGRGYPDRLRGEDIPLIARILAVAESCDAMMSPRPYRPALAPVKVEAALAEGAGRQWDPGVVQEFMACRTDLYALCGQGPGTSVASAVERAVEVWNVGSSQSVVQGGAAAVTVACQDTVQTRGR